MEEEPCQPKLSHIQRPKCFALLEVGIVTLSEGQIYRFRCQDLFSSHIERVTETVDGALFNF